MRTIRIILILVDCRKRYAEEFPFCSRFYLEGRKKQNYKTLNFFIDPTKACYETQRLPIEDEEKIENLRCQTSDHPLWMDAKDVTR